MAVKENLKACLTSDKNYWETPQALFDELNEEFEFTLDPCSTHENAKCEYHFTIEENGLLQDWSGQRVYCNPPYGRNETGKWVEKAYNEVKKEGTLVVMLLPSRTDTKWFHEYIYKKAEVRFLKGRIKFTINKQESQSAPFPSMIVVFRNENETKQRLLYALQNFFEREYDQEIQSLDEFLSIIPIAYTTTENETLEVQVNFNLKKLQWEEFIGDELVYVHERNSLEEFINEIENATFDEIVSDILYEANERERKCEIKK